VTGPRGTVIDRLPQIGVLRAESTDPTFGHRMAGTPGVRGQPDNDVPLVPEDVELALQPEPTPRAGGPQGPPGRPPGGDDRPTPVRIGSALGDAPTARQTGH